LTWWEAGLLGLIQGLTEFFPVSSSGHLVIGQAVLGLAIPGIFFDVVVHVATLFSVLIVYRERFRFLVRGTVGRGEPNAWPYLWKLGLATIPAVVVGFTLRDFFEARFDEPIFAATLILVTGCIVWSSRWALGTHPFGPLELVPFVVAAGFSALAGTIVPFWLVLGLVTAIMLLSRLTAGSAEPALREPTWGGALVMGIAQAAAIFPGITRSGTTVVAGLWRRIDPVVAAEFSFLMSVPAIIGAVVLQAPDALREGVGVGAVPLMVGFAAAAVSGVLAIQFFVALLRRQNFFVFAYYAWAVAGLFLLAYR
jgi:undecaprenyl-diphosphatase